MSDHLTPFKLVSAALYLSRENYSAIFEKQRKVYKHFDQLRGQRDPSADQLANMDVMLRSIEDECADNRNGQGFSEDRAGLQFHIQLSRMWVFSAYEAVRRIHEVLLKSSIRPEDCVQQENGCGQMTCVCCKVGHLKNDFAVVRMPIAKQADANRIFRPPLVSGTREALLAKPEPTRPALSEYLVDGEAMLASGSMSWFRLDKRIDKNRIFSRRSLSDSILHFLD